MRTLHRTDFLQKSKSGESGKSEVDEVYDEAS